jgi:hypothetical protein
MKPSRNPFALFSGERTVDMAVFFLLVLVSFCLIRPGPASGGSAAGLSFLVRDLFLLFLLISLFLASGTLLQFLDAVRERDPRKQEPFECSIDSAPETKRFSWNGAPADLIPFAIDYLDRNFSRYYVFHCFHAPHIYYYYLAKRGMASLFAPPWIKTGFLILFLSLCAWTGSGNLPSAQGTGLLALTLAVGFWIPGFLILYFRPYQKLWLCLVDQERPAQVALTCVSPYRNMRRNTLCESAESFLLDASRKHVPGRQPRFFPEPQQGRPTAQGQEESVSSSIH